MGYSSIYFVLILCLSTPSLAANGLVGLRNKIKSLRGQCKGQNYELFSMGKVSQAGNGSVPLPVHMLRNELNMSSCPGVDKEIKKATSSLNLPSQNHSISNYRNFITDESRKEAVLCYHTVEYKRNRSGGIDIHYSFHRVKHTKYDKRTSNSHEKGMNDRVLSSANETFTVPANGNIKDESECLGEKEVKNVKNCKWEAVPRANDGNCSGSMICEPIFFDRTAQKTSMKVRADNVSCMLGAKSSCGEVDTQDCLNWSGSAEVQRFTPEVDQ